MYDLKSSYLFSIIFFYSCILSNWVCNNFMSYYNFNNYSPSFLDLYNNYYTAPTIIWQSNYVFSNKDKSLAIYL